MERIDTADSFPFKRSKVKVGNDQEKVKKEIPTLKKPRWEKTKITIRYLYYENIR